MSKLKNVSIRLIYPVIIWIVSTLIAVFFVIKNDGFGRSDIQGFSILTLIFSVSSFFLYGLFEKIFKRVHILVAFILTIAFTFVQAIIFIYTAWFIFGPWLGAFSFPIFRIWLIAIGIGNFYVLTNSENKFGLKHLLGIVGAGIVVYALTFFYGLNQNLRTEKQNFDIICLSWAPSDKVPQTSELTKWSLTEKEATDIIDLGIKGDFWGQRFFRVEDSKIISLENPNLSFEEKQNSILFTFGNDIDTAKTNERPKVIIIMNHPQEKDFIFEQSVNETIIVLQNEKQDGFTIYPDKYALNIKKIRIEKTDFRSFPYWAEISIELKGKNDFSVNGFQWVDR
jgi:hypothetical protein